MPDFSHKINYTGIGVLKSATSWIFQCIEEHPDLLTAKPTNNKELNFFNFNYYKGHHWYESQFDFDGRSAGEYSPLYFHNPAVPGRIHEYNPEMKLILSLRNPVDRLLSHHKHEFRRGRLPDDNYDLQRFIGLNPLYVSIGRYATHLKRFLNFFSFDQIHVITMREIKRNPGTVTTKLYDFLDVDPEFQPSVLNERRNVGHVPRSRTLQKLRFMTSTYLRKYLGDSSMEALKTLGLDQVVKGVNKKRITSRDFCEPDDQTLEELHELYRPQINELEDLLGVSLEHWKTKRTP